MRNLSRYQEVILLICFLSITRVVSASGVYDNLTENVATLFDSRDCQKDGIAKAMAPSEESQLCLKSHSSGTEQLLKIKNQIIFRKFADQEQKSLQCSVERWTDLEFKPENDPIVLDMVKRVNFELPELRKLHAAIQTLSTANPTLAISNDRSLQPAERTKKMVDAQTKFNEDLITLRNTYSFHLAKIPFSDYSIFKDLIESKVTDSSKQPKPFTAADLKNVAKNIRQRLATEKNEIEDSLKTNNYSSAVEKKIILNPDHTQDVVSESPELAAAVFALQCQVDRRLTGDFIVNAAASVASLGASTGAILLARASRLAMISKSTAAAVSSADWARKMNFSATAVSSVQSYYFVVNMCSRNIAAVKSSCVASSESFEVDRRMINCIQAGTLAAGNAAAAVASMRNIPQVPAKSLESIKFAERRAAASLQQATASTKSKDFLLDDLITIESKVNGEIQRVEAKIVGRELAADGSVRFKVTTKNLAGESVTAPLTESQLRALNPGPSLAASTNSALGMEVSQLDDPAAWEKYFGTLKIIKSPESKVVPVASVADGKVYIPALGTNNPKAKMKNGMGSTEITPIEVMGPAEKIDGSFKYPVKISDASAREPKIKYLTEAEIVRMVPLSQRKPPVQP